jgi:hypothetical protein
MLQCVTYIIDILEDDAVLVEQILQQSPHKIKDAGVSVTDVESCEEKCGHQKEELSSLFTEYHPHLNEIR